MNTAAVALSAGSLVLVLGITISYFSKVAEARLSKKIAFLVVQLLVGLAMAVGSILWGRESGTLGVALVAPASFAIMLSTMLLFFLSQRMTPVGDIKVKVGDTLLPFKSTTAQGEAFSSESFAGQRVLLKFFRGGW